MYTYDAVIKKVVDGDTMDLLIDVGFDIHISTRIRLAEVNTPEMTTPDGLIAKAFVTDLVNKCGGKCIVRTKRKGKYGRWISLIEIEGFDLGESLLQNGYATKVK